MWQTWWSPATAESGSELRTWHHRPQLVAVPASGWSELGYATEDGVTITSDHTVTAVMAWQALGAIRNLITDAPLAVKFTCIEVTPAGGGAGLRWRRCDGEQVHAW